MEAARHISCNSAGAKGAIAGLAASYNSAPDNGSVLWCPVVLRNSRLAMVRNQEAALLNIDLEKKILQP